MSASGEFPQHLDHYNEPNDSQNPELNKHSENSGPHPELKQEPGMSIDDIDKMISESINQGGNIDSGFNNILEKRHDLESGSAEVGPNKRPRLEHDLGNDNRSQQEMDLELEKAIIDHHNQSLQQSQIHQHQHEHATLHFHDLHQENANLQSHHQEPHLGNGSQHHEHIQPGISSEEHGIAVDEVQKSADDETANLQMIANELTAATNTAKEAFSDQQSPGNTHGQQNHTTSTGDTGNSMVDPAIQGPIQGSSYNSINLQQNKDDTQAKAASESQEKPRLVLHDGINVPADSELLNTSSALAAYNAISTQLPPLATLAAAHLAALPLSITCPDYLPPRIQLLINTLPTLDNLASQLLRIVAMGPYQKILDLVAQHDTPAGATYRDLTSLFEFTKKLYSEDDPFLTVEHIAPGMWKNGEKTPTMFRNREQSIELTLRKVNLATFLGATLGTIEVGFFYLNESFLDIFCPVNNLDPENSLSNMSYKNMTLQSGINSGIGEVVGKLMKPQSVLYLDLKTQAFISAVEAGDRSRDEILEDIIPSNLDEFLLRRRGTKILTPTELDFIERCKARKEYLLKYNSETADLSEEYEWLTFLKELFEYASKNMGFLIWGKKGRLARDKYLDPNGSKDDSLKPHSQELLEAEKKIREEQQEEVERRRVQDALRTQDYDGISKALLPSEIQEQQIHLRINPQSNVRNAQRRPWTKEEEKALRQALELKGPQWSVILEYFGAGGKVNETLKNRTQVQLKDKARNWKMFFLKAGLPVPEYLLKVTGDLERDDKFKQKLKKLQERKPV